MAALRNRKMGSILDNNKSFCLAPWIHSYISPQGLRQICCVAEHNFGINQPLESIWNSDEMKNIRTKMMNGEILSACNRCNDKSINPNPYRDYFNRQYEWYINGILSNTNEDGTFNGLPRTFDYRTNVCNFKCKMCSEEFSSQIQGEKINNGLDLQFNILNSEERERSLQIINNEFSNDEILKNVLEIYWAGGEPMYWKTHWETLDRLIEKGYAKNVKLRYHSNLSSIEYKGNLLTDYFKHFKDVQFCCSLDGTNLIGEWVRTNLNWNKWKENFTKLVEFRNQNKHIEIKLAITVTTATLFDFENLYELCNEFNIEPEFQSCYAENASNLLAPRSFPKNIIIGIVDTFLNSHIEEENYIINKFRKYKEFLSNETFFENDLTYEQDLLMGIKVLDEVEKNRKHEFINFENIISINKELLNFYLNIKLNKLL